MPLIIKTLLLNATFIVRYCFLFLIVSQARCKFSIPKDAFTHREALPNCIKYLILKVFTQNSCKKTQNPSVVKMIIFSGVIQP